jgi:hypothetical protein
MLVKDLYYEKYLKYKNKYLNLQSQIGGARLYFILLPINRNSIILQELSILDFVYSKNLQLGPQQIKKENDSTFFTEPITVTYSSIYNSSNNSRNFTVQFTATDNGYDPDADDLDEYEYQIEANSPWDRAIQIGERKCNIEKFVDNNMKLDDTFYKITFTETEPLTYILSTNLELLTQYLQELKKKL